MRQVHIRTPKSKVFLRIRTFPTRTRIRKFLIRIRKIVTLTRFRKVFARTNIRNVPFAQASLSSYPCPSRKILIRARIFRSLSVSV
jgi:hypothetical protein